ncbi:peptidoglycan-binding protein [Streptosporangium sp. NPDC023825]|uniref:peptidoglycan-binding protein n=1 Tax=Streptosporangium sp. NPDC023825 TaxID=3154909 RepID=UPI00343756EA
MNVKITADEMIAVAKEQLGYIEPASGKTKFGIWYGDRVDDSGFDDAAWCDMSLVWCAWEAGRRKGGKAAAEAAVEQVGQFAYTPWHAGYWARKGRFNNTPSKGALAFFNWSGPHSLNAIDHVGLVIGTTDRGEIITLEGNTTSNGKVGFYKRYRHRSSIVGFAHPAYVKAGSVKPQPAKTTKYPLAAGKWFGPTATDKTNVKRIQKRLGEQGHEVPVDGAYGPKTVTAVKAFQERSNLTVDGLVGPITWAALF